MRTVEDICAYYEEKIAPEMTIVEEYFETIRQQKLKVVLTSLAVFPVLGALVFFKILHWLALAIAIPVVALAAVWVFNGLFESEAEREKPVFLQQKVFPAYTTLLLTLMLGVLAFMGIVHWLYILLVVPLALLSFWIYQNFGAISDDSAALKGMIVKKLITYLNPTFGHKTASFVDTTLKKIVEKDYNFKLMSLGALTYDEFYNSKLFPLKADLADSYFYVTGKLQGRSLKLAEMHVAQEEGEEVFKGLFFIGQMPNEAPASIFFTPDDTRQVFSKLGKNIMQFNFGRGELVEIPEPNLAKKYVVYSDSPNLTGSLLPLSLMMLCDQTSQTIGLPVSFSWVKDKIYLAIPTPDLLQYATMETLRAHSKDEPNTVIKNFFIRVTAGIQLLSSQLVQ